MGNLGELRGDVGTRVEQRERKEEVTESRGKTQRPEEGQREAKLERNEEIVRRLEMIAEEI